MTEEKESEAIRTETSEVFDQPGACHSCEKEDQMEFLKMPLTEGLFLSVCKSCGGGMLQDMRMEGVNSVKLVTHGTENPWMSPKEYQAALKRFRKAQTKQNGRF